VIDTSSCSCKTKFKSAVSVALSAPSTIRAPLWAGRAGLGKRASHKEGVRRTAALTSFGVRGMLSCPSRPETAWSVPSPGRPRRQGNAKNLACLLSTAHQLYTARQKPRPKFSVSSVQASPGPGRCSSGAAPRQVLPNPSFKGEAQRHVTLAIKRRGLRPILRLLSSAPCRRSPP
jgi:hypothetical protein